MSCTSPVACMLAKVDADSQFAKAPTCQAKVAADLPSWCAQVVKQTSQQSHLSCSTCIEKNTGIKHNMLNDATHVLVVANETEATLLELFHHCMPTGSMRCQIELHLFTNGCKTHCIEEGCGILLKNTHKFKIDEKQLSLAYRAVLTKLSQGWESQLSTDSKTYLLKKASTHPLTKQEFRLIAWILHQLNFEKDAVQYDVLNCTLKIQAPLLPSFMECTGFEVAS